MANGKKTGGRQRGTPNRATAARHAEIAASGLTPLDYLLRIMRDETVDSIQRFEAAKAAAPYVHSKLASVAHSGGLELEHDVGDSVVALMKRIERQGRKLHQQASGEISSAFAAGA